MAHALVDGERRRRCSSSTPAPPGIAVVDDPPFTHNYPHGHPTLRFDVEVGADAVIGGVGGGEDLQRGVVRRGAARDRRALRRRDDAAAGGDDGVGGGREQGGARLIDHQGVSFPLADSAADAAAGRLLGLEVARLCDAGADPKLVHAKASMAKLFCQRGGQPLRRPLRCRCSAAAATCARTSPSASGASCAWTASGRARARSSG